KNSNQDRGTKAQAAAPAYDDEEDETLEERRQHLADLVIPQEVDSLSQVKHDERKECIGIARPAAHAFGGRDHGECQAAQDAAVCECSPTKIIRELDPAYPDQFRQRQAVIAVLGPKPLGGDWPTGQDINETPFVVVGNVEAVSIRIGESSQQ